MALTIYGSIKPENKEIIEQLKFQYDCKFGDQVQVKFEGTDMQIYCPLNHLASGFVAKLGKFFEEKSIVQELKIKPVTHRTDKELNELKELLISQNNMWRQSIIIDALDIDAIRESDKCEQSIKLVEQELEARRIPEIPLP